MMSRQDNERLLDLISHYLTFSPAAIQPETVSLLTTHGLSLNEAYLAVLAARMGLDPSNPDDEWLCQYALPRMVRQHDPAAYEADAYFQAVKPAPERLDGIDLVYETIEPMELFVADDFIKDSTCFALPQLGWFSRAFTFPAIRENDQVWMTVTPNEINTIQPAVQQSQGKVLTYGLGLGYYAFHCLLRNDVESVTVVEHHPRIIDVFTKLLLPFFPRQKDLHIIQADAFDYARDVMPQAGFDTVFTDLWRDVTDGIPLYRRMKSLEAAGPHYLYWIEKTLKLYMDW